MGGAKVRGKMHKEGEALSRGMWVAVEASEALREVIFPRASRRKTALSKP